MSFIFEQVFYRLKTGDRRVSPQTITVQVPVGDGSMHPQKRKSLAKKALYDLPGTGFKSGWTVWMFGKSRTIAEDQAQAIEHTPEPHRPQRADTVYTHTDPGVTKPQTAPAPVEAVEEPTPEPEVEHTPETAKAALKQFSRHKIKNVYDEPEFPIWAVDLLQPDFEYADWKEERVNKLWKR